MLISRYRKSFFLRKLLAVLGRTKAFPSIGRSVCIRSSLASSIQGVTREFRIVSFDDNSRGSGFSISRNVCIDRTHIRSFVRSSPLLSPSFLFFSFLFLFFPLVLSLSLFTNTPCFYNPREIFLFDDACTLFFARDAWNTVCSFHEGIARPTILPRLKINFSTFRAAPCSCFARY